MRKGYSTKNFLLIAASLMVLLFASCKKESTNVTTKTLNVVTPDATPVNLGLYEADSSIYKLTFMNVSQVGTKTINDALVFDTGSGGMVIDAEGILPQTMITSSGFNFTGDSIVVNGVTITSDTATVEYGADDSTLTKAYGNLAYANVTLGDDQGNIVIKRLPFFLYYKGVDANNNPLPSHYFDVMGVNQEYDLTFPKNNVPLTSPLTFYDPGKNLTKGFKIAALGTSNFSLQGTYVADALTVGLTQADLTTSNFEMNQLTLYPGDGYPPIFSSTFNYNSKTISSYVLFDTGTAPYSYIEDPTATTDIALLPSNTQVTLRLTSGFDYQYTTTPFENLTYIENPNTTGGGISIMGLEFFLTNEYLLDYTDHKLGVKNN